MRRFCAAVALALLFTAANLLAFSVKSSILGTVTDATGAVVSGATVTVTNTGTNSSRQVTTNAQGDYLVAELDPGQYSVTVEAAGFKQFKRTLFDLQVDQRLRVDAAMTVGEVSEHIEVSGQPPLVETDSSTVGQVIDRNQVNGLPLNGRFFLQLALLTPGSNAGYPGNRQQGNQIGGVALAVNGARSASNNYMVDGIDNNLGFNGYFSLSPSVDAIQEFKVQTGNSSAEFGRSAGAQVNLVTRSGTNAFHGSLFEFLRNDSLDAVDSFSKAYGGVVEKPPYHRNQFGGSLGGPVIIPGVYNGKNRTFFFFSYEGTRVRKAWPALSSVPTDAMRNGNFSGMATVYDPLDVVGGVRQPFPNNQIPANRISDASKFLQGFVPHATGSGISANFFRNAPYKDDVNQEVLRLDQHVTDKGQFMARFVYDHRAVVSPSNFGTPAIGAGGFGSGATETDDPHTAAASYTWTLRPTLLNDFRVGYNRFVWLYLHDNAGHDYAKEAGIQGLPGDKMVVGFPRISIGDFTSWGDGDWLPNNTYPDETYQLSDAITWIKGRHSIKGGIELRRNHRYFLTGGSFRGGFGFDGSFTRPDVNTPGTPYADFLLGFPSDASRTVGTNVIYSQTWFENFFIQDDFKVSDRLTLNLGLRYELNPPSTEKFNHLSNYDFSSGTLAYANAADIPQNVSFPTSVSKSASTIQTDKNNFAPRFGMAYRLTRDNRTVFRAAYGIYYDVETGNPQVNLGSNPPFQYTTSVPIVRDAAPVTRYETAFTYIPQYSDSAPWLEAIQMNFRDGYLQQWQASLQRELFPSFLVEAGYVGSKGTHLIGRQWLNRPLPGPNRGQQDRQNPAFGTLQYNGSFASSTYHSLQLKAEKRFSKGLSFLTAFTWGKSLDNTSDFTADSVPDPNNTSTYMRGPSDFDQTFRFVQSWLYELPFGKGRRFLSGGPRVLDYVLGGWNLNGIYTWGTGFPYTVYIGWDQAGNWQSGQRANVVGDWHVSHPTREQWFNPAAFEVPEAYTFGNTGRNILRGPNYSNLDFSIMKRFRVAESHRFEFRTELFNAFNTVHLGYPNASIGYAESAGRIDYAIGDNRRIQMALRYEF